MLPKRLIIFLVVFVLAVFVLIFSRSVEFFQTEERPWFEKTTEEFYKRFQRPLDPIHIAYYDIQCKSKTLHNSMKFISRDLDSYSGEVGQGKQKSKNSSIVIAGLVRNAAFQIPEMKERCYNITKMFKKYKIVIVENNSTDNSREFLLDWFNEDPNVIILCQDIFATNQKECDILDLFPKSENLGNSPHPQRIQKMAFLRNVYLKHIQHYYSDYDYLCVMDMDLKGDLFNDGLLHSVNILESHPQLDAVACNGMLFQSSGQYIYYDSFAHIETGDPYVWENQTAKSNHDRYVHSYITDKYLTSMDLDKVRSAFGGIVLYKNKKVKDKLYDFSSNFFSCEHSYFHKNLNIAVNPRFIFLISQNGN